MINIFRFFKLSGIISAILLMMQNAYGAPSAKPAPENQDEIHMQWNMESVALYQHEPVTLTLYLWSPEIEINGLKEIAPGHLDKGDFSYVSHADFDRRPRRRMLNGKPWIVYPVDSYVVTLDKPGKHRLSGSKYIIDTAVPEIIDDPYWGSVKSYKRAQKTIEVAPMTFEVKALPNKDNTESFSGAVGNFEVKVSVPPGEIYMNEEAIVIVTVTGDGWINDHILPEYRGAFGKGTKLRSVSEDRKKYMADGRLVSELILECTFLPTSLDEAIIGPVQMGFFNPTTGEYSIAASEPVNVKVQSIAMKAPSIDI